jgi:hypothetical protein
MSNDILGNAKKIALSHSMDICCCANTARWILATSLMFSTVILRMITDFPKGTYSRLKRQFMSRIKV